MVGVSSKPWEGDEQTQTAREISRPQDNIRSRSGSRCESGTAKHSVIAVQLRSVEVRESGTRSGSGGLFQHRNPRCGM